MKNFVIVIGAVVLALFIITFIVYPSILPIHIILGIAFIIAVLGFFKMRNIKKV